MLASKAPGLHGHCCCGQATFTIDSADDVRFGFASCHCSICRLSHGAPFVLWSGFDSSLSSSFKSQTQVGLTAFRSSPNCTRYFCSSCGTHLYIKYDDAIEGGGTWAGEVHFPTALLDNDSVDELEKVGSDVFNTTTHANTHCYILSIFLLVSH